MLQHYVQWGKVCQDFIIFDFGRNLKVSFDKKTFDHFECKCDAFFERLLAIVIQTPQLIDAWCNPVLQWSNLTGKDSAKGSYNHKTSSL